jgi:hypothetical protein
MVSVRPMLPRPADFTRSRGVTSPPPSRRWQPPFDAVNPHEDLRTSWSKPRCAEEDVMDDVERATGTPNDSYDLVSVLYHALQGGETSQQYIDDARQAGDEELVAFFAQVQAEERSRAGNAKRLLMDRLQLAAH